MNRFRKYLVVFCMLAMIGASSTAFAKPIVTTLDKVIVGSNGMQYVHTGEGLLPVSSVEEAQDGYFIAIPKPSADYEGIEWQCPRCGADNVGGGTCSVCGWPLYDDDDI